MSETANFFKDAKVGDEVLCARKGWMVIRSIHHGLEYPIRTQYGSYSLDGKYLDTDAAPTLWPADKVPQYYLDLFPRPKKKTKKVFECTIIIHEIRTDGTSEEIPVKMKGEYEVEE